MIHPDTELRFINERIGHGVVATKFIPKGTVTWVLDKFDHIFEPEYVRRLEEPYKKIVDKYCYRNRYGKYVLCWDIAKFVNHSSNSSCVTTAYEYEVAVRDIYPGEQLTDDYGYLNLEEPFECEPEQGEGRTLILPDDPLRMYEHWDSLLNEALSHYKSVQQPLEVFMKKNIREKTELILSGKEKMESTLSCYYKGKDGVFHK
jgi:uncharacterized protein